MDMHVFEPNFSACTREGLLCFILSCKGPFRGRYGCKREDSLKMATVMCRNMPQTY